MKQKLKRFMAGFMAMLTLVGTLFTNGTTAFAASPQANIAFWNASVKNSGEVSELKPGYNHGKILYSILDGNSAYCMNFAPQSYPTFAYSGAYAPLLCSYWGGSQGYSTTRVRAHVVSDLLTLVSLF